MSVVIVGVIRRKPVLTHVVSAGTTNTFKNRLDKFWSDQDILYDYKADLHGIGNRSVVY